MLILFKEKAPVVLTAERLELKSTLTELGCCGNKTPTPQITSSNEMDSDFPMKT